METVECTVQTHMALVNAKRQLSSSMWEPIEKSRGRIPHLLAGRDWGLLASLQKWMHCSTWLSKGFLYPSCPSGSCQGYLSNALLELSIRNNKHAYRFISSLLGPLLILSPPCLYAPFSAHGHWVRRRQGFGRTQRARNMTGKSLYGWKKTMAVIEKHIW